MLQFEGLGLKSEGPSVRTEVRFQDCGSLATERRVSKSSLKPRARKL